VTSGGGPQYRHAGHRCGCLPSAARRHGACHHGDRHHGPWCGENRRTGAWRRPAGHPRRPLGGVIRQNPHPTNRRDADGPHPAAPGGHTACLHRVGVHRNRTGGHRRGPGTSLNRQRPARTSHLGGDRPVKVGRRTQSRLGRRGRTRCRPAGHRDPPVARTFWPFRHGKARRRHGRNPGPQSRPRHRGMRRQRPGTRQNRCGTGPGPSSGETVSRFAGQAGMGRRGPARCRHCHDRSRPLCSS